MVALSDLPPELLADIVAETARVWPHLLWKQPGNKFRRLDDDWKDSNTLEEQSHYYTDCPNIHKYDDVCTLCTETKLGFIILTHVCHTLREITISMPILWTSISDLAYPYSDSNWIQAFLTRSQNLPLKYAHRGDWPNEGRTLRLRDLYLQGLPRIRTLYLAIRGGLPTLDPFSEFMTGAVSLENLILTRLPARPLRLPDDFPWTRLRDLALPTFDPTSMPWHNDGIRNLTGLKLSFAHMRPVSSASLLNGLRMLHRIETLHLLDVPVLVSAGLTPAIDVDSVELPHLASLTLYGRARGVMELLNRLTAPNVREVDVVCYKFIAEFKSTLAQLPQWVPGLAFSSSPNEDYVTASVIHDESNSKSNSSLTLGLSRILGADSGPLHFRFTAEWEQRWATEGEEDQENLSPTDVLEIVVPTILDPWAASRIKHLSVSLDACSSRSLRRCISPFTSVSTLSASGFMTLSCLVELMAQSGPDASTSTLFPELSMLRARTAQGEHTSLDGLIATMVEFRAQIGQTIQWRTFT